ncbi:hypothetical protein RQP46_008591 [Phenoliferia psychrophenolica]
MPRAGDRFKDATAFEDACWNASRAYMGYNTHCWPNKTGRTDVIDIRCSQYTPKSCKFRVYARLVPVDDNGGGESGEWIVDDGTRSFWTHSHGRNPKIKADPAWRPIVGYRSKYRQTEIFSGPLDDTTPSVTIADQTLNAGKRRASDPADGDDNDYQKRGKIAKTSIPTAPLNFGSEFHAQSGPSHASRAYATPALSPSPSGSIPPPPSPLPTFTDQPLSISDLNKLLTSLSPLLAPPDIAIALHQFGIDSVARFANLVFARSEWVTEALGESGAQISLLRRVMLMNALAAKRAEFEVPR